ncbi:hypothetical protein Bca52824_017200 [Brassica carinata]|uniref:Uncharacterized protein n=1 Tax=Brassica carinata TaxID=52824 RepID=A0A8X8AX61_BRACI|nr:hypothetical protein Bca52824_017200 [Brassica carinata]
MEPISWWFQGEEDGVRVKAWSFSTHSCDEAWLTTVGARSWSRWFQPRTRARRKEELCDVDLDSDRARPEISHGEDLKFRSRNHEGDEV